MFFVVKSKEKWEIQYAHRLKLLHTDKRCMFNVTRTRFSHFKNKIDKELQQFTNYLLRRINITFRMIDVWYGFVRRYTFKLKAELVSGVTAIQDNFCKVFFSQLF